MSSEPSIPLPEFREVTKVLTVNREIKQIAEEWAEMATRAWPEMVQIANPISEDDFLKWVSEKMNVIQPLGSLLLSKNCHFQPKQSVNQPLTD